MTGARHVTRTLLQYAVVLLAAICLNFALPRLAPGTVSDYLFPPEQAGSLTAQQRAQVLQAFGLDQPLPTQFGRYLAGLSHGDLLLSVRFGRPVSALLAERIGWTLLLVGTALVLATALGVLLGFRSAWRRGHAGDATELSAVMLLDSLPSFFVGMLLLLVFSVQLGWLPTFGAQPPAASGTLDLIIEVGKRLVLPLVTLTLASMGPVYLVARSALLGELREDYVLMAQAKGLTSRQVRRHAQRNALIPVSTITLVGLGTVVGGAVVVETVFSYPGIGRLIYDSVLARDYPVLQGAFLVLVVAVLAANLISDLLYPLLDPRVRRPAGSSR